MNEPGEIAPYGFPVPIGGPLADLQASIAAAYWDSMVRVGEFRCPTPGAYGRYLTHNQTVSGKRRKAYSGPGHYMMAGL
jgi:hypothetical protein